MALPLPATISHLEDLQRRIRLTQSGDQLPEAMAKRQKIAEHYFDVDVSTQKMPRGVRRKSTLAFDSIRGEWFCPDTAHGQYDRLLYIHGGAMTGGGILPRLGFAAKLAAATQTVVLAVDYRKSPQDSYSASLADCLAAYAWILVHGPEDRESTDHAYILGDSEGATLTLTTLQLIQQRGLQPPAAAVAISPLTDWNHFDQRWHQLEAIDPYLSRRLLFDLREFRFGTSEGPKNPQFSPVNNDPEGLPPVLLQVGEREILLDDAKLYAKKMRTADVPVCVDVTPGMPHAFPLFSPFLSQSNEALQRVAAFIRNSSRTTGAGGNVTTLQPKSMHCTVASDDVAPQIKPVEEYAK